MTRQFSGNLVADLLTEDGLTVPVLVADGGMELLGLEKDFASYRVKIVPTKREVRFGDEVLILDMGIYTLGVVSRYAFGEGDLIAEVIVSVEE